MVHSIMPDLVHKPSSTQDQQIGRWGEELVYNYLNKEMNRPDSNITNVEWVQQEGEKGTPYEFIVTLRGKFTNRYWVVGR